ncbi:MAG: NlpC/P60 family protein [Rhizomicrobium sp.]
MQIDAATRARAASFAESVIGTPWEKGAAGPNAYDCWGLVRTCQHVVFDRDLPIVNVDPNNARSVARALKGHPLMQLWPERARRQHGDVVSMEHDNSPGHVGIFLDIDRGGVLHAIEGAGVRFDALAMIRILGWRYLRFYGPASEVAA